MQNCSVCVSLGYKGLCSPYRKDTCVVGGGAIIVVVVCPDHEIDSTRKALVDIANSHPNECGVAYPVGVFKEYHYEETGGGQGQAIRAIYNSWEQPTSGWSTGKVFPVDHWHGRPTASVYLAALNTREVSIWYNAMRVDEPVCMLRYTDSGTHLDNIRQLVPQLAEKMMERYQSVQLDEENRRQLEIDERQRLIAKSKMISFLSY